MEPVKLDASLFAPLPHPNKATFSSDERGPVGSALRIGAGYLVSDAAGQIIGNASDLATASKLAHGAA